jgi:hypothetical protein
MTPFALKELTVSHALHNWIPIGGKASLQLKFAASLQETSIPRGPNYPQSSSINIRIVTLEVGKVVQILT